MGGDGGSIPKRDDLVKLKAGDQKAEKKSRDRQLWSTCALSKEPLLAPIVSCPLGKLYNKTALLSYLLTPSSFGTEGPLIAGHIRSLRDVTLLALTPNPALLTQSTEETESSTHIGTQEVRPTALFVCPVSLREMNGSVKFVYRKPCGCVISDVSLREMRAVKKKPSGGDKGNPADAEAEEATKTCPVTGTEDGGPEEWVTLNPREDELEQMRDAWEAKKVAEKEAKKLAKGHKKRKDGPTEADDPTKAKKAKPASTTTGDAIPAIKAGSSIPLLSATLAAKIAEQKKAHSPAIASLYARKNADSTHDAQGRSNWMVQSTFTRHA